MKKKKLLLKKTKNGFESNNWSTKNHSMTITYPAFCIISSISIDFFQGCHESIQFPKIVNRELLARFVKRQLNAFYSNGLKIGEAEKTQIKNEIIAFIEQTSDMCEPL